MDMIQGLKLAFTGDEIIRGLDARIAACRAEVATTTGPGAAHDIQALEHRISVLTLFRERIFPPRIYLLGRKSLRMAGLLPSRDEQARATAASPAPWSLVTHGDV